MTYPSKQVSPQPALTSAHKAAVILASLSPETASAIVQEISDAHLKAFARAFSELKSVPASLLQAVAHEFVSEVEKTSTELSGGIAEAKRMLESLTEEERVNRILSELSGGGLQSVWKRLAAAPPERILAYVKLQRMPIAAAIVSRLPFDQAATVLSSADQGFSHAVLSELSKTPSPSPETFDAIARAIEEDFLKPLASAPSDGGANEIVGEIINFLPSAKRDAFLSHLDAEDRHIAAAVRRSVLTFQDLHLRLPEAGAAALLRIVEKDVLLAALKHGRENATQAVAFLMGNVSKRMADQYAEEMDAMPTLSEENGESAQREVMKKLRDLARVGEIKLAPPPAADPAAE